MSINYQNKVKSLEVKNIGDFRNVISKIHWQRRGIDSNFSSSVFIGFHKLDTQNIDSGSFIEYENLTESQVLDWIMNEKPSEFWTKVDRRIESDISSSHSEVEEKFELPWQQQ